MFFANSTRRWHHRCIPSISRRGRHFCKPSRRCDSARLWEKGNMVLQKTKRQYRKCCNELGHHPLSKRPICSNSHSRSAPLGELRHEQYAAVGYGLSGEADCSREGYDTQMGCNEAKQYLHHTSASPSLMRRLWLGAQGPDPSAMERYLCLFEIGLADLPANVGRPTTIIRSGFTLLFVFLESFNLLARDQQNNQLVLYD